MRRGEEGLAVFGHLLRKEVEPQEVPLSKQSKLARSSRELHQGNPAVAATFGV